MIYRLLVANLMFSLVGCEPKEELPPPSVVVSVAQQQPSAPALGVKVVAATRGGALLRIEVTGGTVTAPGIQEPSQVLCVRVRDGLHPMVIAPTGDEALVSSALFGAEVPMDGSVTSGAACSTGAAVPLDTDVTPIAKAPATAVVEDAAADTADAERDDSGTADTLTADAEGDAG